MDERTFWVRIWQTIIVGVVLILFNFSGCAIHKNIKITELIKDGHDPIKVRFALRGYPSVFEKSKTLLIDNKQYTDE